jgi:hypothetical protein
MKDLKSRFLAAIGHVCAVGESPAQAFDRLRVETPDAFPVPRSHESFLDACAEVVHEHEADDAASRVARGLHPEPGPHCVECGTRLTPAEVAAQPADCDEVCAACGGPSPC